MANELRMYLHPNALGEAEFGIVGKRFGCMRVWRVGRGDKDSLLDQTSQGPLNSLLNES